MSSAQVDSPWIWCDGEWIAEQDFCIHSADRGVLHGMGAFETMRAENGVLCFAEQHLARFSAAVSILGLAKSDLSALSEIVSELCQRNGCQRGIARVRLTATAGSGPFDLSNEGKMARCWISATPWHEAVNSVICGLLPWRKNNNSSITGIKSTSYAENILALRHAKQRGWNEGIFLTHADQVSEAIMANVLILLGNEIVTPPLASACLPGIMRGVILANGLAKEMTLTYDDLIHADALWLSSALRGLVPVERIDGVEKKQKAFPFSLR